MKLLSREEAEQFADECNNKGMHYLALRDRFKDIAMLLPKGLSHDSKGRYDAPPVFSTDCPGLQLSVRSLVRQALDALPLGQFTIVAIRNYVQARLARPVVTNHLSTELNLLLKKCSHVRVVEKINGRMAIYEKLQNNLGGEQTSPVQ